MSEVTELEMDDVVQGDGQEAKTGDRVRVHYTGWLFDADAEDCRGKKIDSSLDRGQPLQAKLGVGFVIKGWDQGIPGMKIGGKRKLRIPPALGYGHRGVGDVIPPNSSLVFEVELLDIVEKPERPQR